MGIGTSTPSLARRREFGALLVSFAVLVTALAAFVGGMPASAAPAAGSMKLPPSRTFVYTGAEQSYTVPSDVTLLYIEAGGATGGGSTNGVSGSAANIKAFLPVKPGEVLYAEVGQAGAVGGGATVGGGGAAGAQSLDFPVAVAASSGGGATDVQTCSITATTCPGGGKSKKSRLIVAGGGGGNGGTGSADFGYCDSSGFGGEAADTDGVVTTSKGSFISGGGGFDTMSSTPAGGGTDAAPGAGGIQGDCTFENETFPGSAAGSSGSGRSGGIGASGSADAGAGGGGGGGYYGGGGGASGSICTSTPPGCNVDGDGSGGGSGSSFVKSVAVFSGYGGSVAPASVTFTPVIKIAAPQSGATYTLGQPVDASFICDTSILQECTGTVASGQPINTSTIRSPHLRSAKCGGERKLRRSGSGGNGHLHGRLDTYLRYGVMSDVRKS